MTNNKGQTLVIIIILMLISLSIGITISTRFFKNLRSNVETDNASRAVAAAEAAVERLLLISNETLSEYIQFGTCGSNCTLQLPGADGVTANAQVTLSYVGNSSEPISLQLKQTQDTEINLIGFTGDRRIWFCWNNPASGDLPSIAGLYVRKTGQEYIADNFAYNSAGSAYASNGFSTAASNFGYAHCFSVVAAGTPQLMRLKSFYNDIDISVIPDGGTVLPTQGILIDSLGTVGEATKRVKVIKSTYAAPSIFDYAIYSKSADDPLTK